MRKIHLRGDIISFSVNRSTLVHLEKVYTTDVKTIRLRYDGLVIDTWSGFKCTFDTYYYLYYSIYSIYSSITDYQSLVNFNLNNNLNKHVTF